MPLQVGSKNFAEFTVMMHGTTSGGAVPTFISSYVLLASFVVYLAFLLSSISAVKLSHWARKHDIRYLTA